MPVWIAGGVAAAGLGSSIVSGIFGSNAAAEAADAYRAAALTNQQTAYHITDLATQRLQPYTDLGKQATSIYSGVLGGGIDLSKQLSSDPLYQWQQEQGQRMLNRQVAAQGLSGTGAGLELNRRFQSELLGNESARYMGYLTNAAQLGESAAAQGVSASTQAGLGAMQSNITAAGGIANADISKGVAYGNIATGASNALAGAAGMYLNYNMFQNLIGSMGSGGYGGGGGAALSTIYNSPIGPTPYGSPLGSQVIG